MIENIIDPPSRVDIPFQYKTPIFAKAHDDTDGLQNIYVSRKQTAEFLMRDIRDEHFRTVISSTFISGRASFGVLFMKYANDQIQIYTCNKPTDPSNYNDNIAIYVEKFKLFFTAIFKKTFLDSLLRRQNNEPFTQYFSLDLVNRIKNFDLFHQDATDTIHVNYFTLTFIVDEDKHPECILKGPTLIPSHSTYTTIQNQCNLVVGNGTTIGLDNKMLYHATPLSQISKYKTNWPHLVENHYLDPKLVQTKEQDHRHLDKRLLTLLEQNTKNIQIPRFFIRTWYIDNPPSDIRIDGPSIRMPIMSIDLDDELRNEMSTQRITPREYKTADELISELLQSNMALGVQVKHKRKNKISMKRVPNKNTKRVKTVIKKRKTVRKKLIKRK